MFKKLAILFTLFPLLLGCSSRGEESSKKTIYVTITPLRALVEEITGGDYVVQTLVPKGASPETFEPTMKHLMALNDAEQVFSVGLINFEQGLVSSIKGSDRLVNLSDGIELIAGSCTHCNHAHAHGIDPHIWTSPRALKRMVENIGLAMERVAPDSTKYRDNVDKLTHKLSVLDSLCSSNIASNGVDAIMIGRGIVGNPFLIKETLNYYDGKEDYRVSYEERLDMCIKHTQRLIDLMGEKPAIRQMRGIAPHYFTGMPHSAQYRGKLNQIETFAEIIAIVDEFKDLLKKLDI
jgi:hypothetical protein